MVQEITAMEGDDPMDWETDRLVQELCTDIRTWEPPSRSKRPNPAELEKSLRFHEMVGSDLIAEFKDENIKSELGITKFSQIAWMRGAIRSLRMNSKKYQPYRETYMVEDIDSFHTHSHRDFASAVSHAAVGSLSNLAIPPPSSRQTPIIPADTPPDNTASNKNAVDSHYTDNSSPSWKRSNVGEGAILTDKDGDGNSLDGPNAPMQDGGEGHLSLEFPELSEGAVKIPVLDNSAITIVDVNGKKRKRLAPTLMTTDLDPNRNREIPEVLELVTDIIQVPADIEINVPFMGADGRKRIIPFTELSPQNPQENMQENMQENTQRGLLQGQSSPGVITEDAASNFAPVQEPNSYTKSSKFASNFKGSCYLGWRGLPVDDVFYPGIAIGEELTVIPSSNKLAGANEVSTGPNIISPGRRIYVHSAMKRYLRSQPVEFSRQGQTFFAVRPYSTKFLRRFQPPSFTLFRNESGGNVQASRENINFWPELDPDTKDDLPKVVGAERSATFNPPGPDMLALHSIGANHDWDPSNLEKYLLLEGGDEILPLYGESDTENEFDAQTWAEMEKEHNGTIQRPLGPSRGSPLAMDEVVSAIEEGIDALATVWKEKKLPKLEIKGYKIWQKARKRKTWKQDIAKAQYQLADHLRRIKTMRDTFHKETWTKRSAILKQITIMEIDVFGREEKRWMITTLGSKKSPDKPTMSAYLRAKTISPSKTPSNDDVEDGEILDSESDAMSSNISMDDFLESEESGNDEEHELSLSDAVASDEDSTMSDGSLPTRAPSTPKKRKILYQASRFRHPSDPPIEPGSSQSIHRGTPLSNTSLKREESARRIFSSPKLAKSTEVIELSSDEGPVTDLVTPLKPRKPLVILKLTPPANPAPQAITITDDSDSGLGSPPRKLPLHLINARVGIGKVPVTQWAALKDRRKLLIAIFQNMDDDRRGNIFRLIVNKSEPDAAENILWVQMTKVMVAAEYNDKTVEGLTKPVAGFVTMIIGLYDIYITCKYRRYMIRPAPATTPMLKASQKAWFHKFVEQCREIADLFNDEEAKLDVPSSKNRSMKLKYPRVDSDEEQDELQFRGRPKRPAASLDYTDEDGEPFSAVRRKRSEAIPSISDDDLMPDDQPSEDTPRKKKKLVENVEARDLRQQTMYRKAEQEERRKALQLKLALSGRANDEYSGTIIINDTKSDGEGFIFMNNIAAPRIKTHQIEGVRFMWNQIVGDDNAMQGCLLAHTMGLGKTMQVITLLVAIAEASVSSDPTIVSQIPPRLRHSRTIVLCPPSLIDNWMDELLTWAPPDLLGDLFKVDSTVKHMAERVEKINSWFQEGGVLIIGYEMFRIIMTNQGSARTGKPFTDDAHEEITKQLMEGPNIVIADEAHKMKNSESTINKMARKFKSKSRIALTGSPLANNVVEYHTMISWVAPNYLGPIAEFREKYVVPIEEGVWSDCSDYARKKSRKMLAVLNRDIAPKVHRADMKVLRNDLPSKKEFVITVALTDLQKKAYSIYVQSMQSAKGVARSKNGEITQQTLWHWLVVLTLLCNHPSCFESKLEERQADAKDEAKKSAAITDIDEEQDDTPAEEKISSLLLDGTAPLYKSGVSSTLIADAKALFAKECVDITLPELSNKVEVLLKILDASRAVGDKVLVFSQSIPTLDFLENLMKTQGRTFSRLDGKTPMGSRQKKIKEFNAGKTEVYLISTAAGGLGLNLPGANRVVIFDFKFNPIQEEQAVGRAYRIGQKKQTFVYRLVCGGTFEETVHNKTIFKTQLASQVVDKKTLIANASRKISDFLFKPRAVELQDLSEFEGMDPDVLDSVLASDNGHAVRAIVQSESFARDDNEVLSAEDMKHVDAMADDESLKRTNPKAFEEKQRSRAAQAHAHAQQAYQAHVAMQARLVQTASRRNQSLNSVNPAQQPSPRYLPPENSNASGTPRSNTLVGNSVEKETRIVPGSKPLPPTTNCGLIQTATSSQTTPGDSTLILQDLIKQRGDPMTLPTPKKTPTSSQQRGRSPVCGAGTKVRAATPDSTKASLEHISKNLTESAATQSESSQDDMSNTAMFAAMNKKPLVSSLKTPVLKDHQHSRQSRSTAQESREVRRANEKRRASRIIPPPKPTHASPAPKFTSSKPPSWSKEQPSGRRSSSRPPNRKESRSWRHAA